MQTLFVTGATGLVGSHVVADAIARGYRVRALVRPGYELPAVELMNHPAFEVISGDLCDIRPWQSALDGVDAVIHAGAMVGDSGVAADYMKVNVEGTLALTRVAKAAGSVRRFVLVSSLGVYQGRDHFGSDESVAIDRAGLDAYTRSKAESEVQFLAEAKALGLVATAVRPGFIYGERDRTVVPRLLDQLAKGRVVYFGSSDRKTNCIYVRNLSYGIFLALTAEAQKIDGLTFNLTDDPTATKREFLETLALEAGLPPPRMSIPRPLALTLAELSELAAKLGLVEKPLVSKAAFKFLGLNLDYSIARAKAVLGYQPPFGFKEGLKATISWFKEAGAIPAYRGSGR